MKIKKYTEVEKNPVNMEGAKDVDIRLLINSSDQAPNFAMRMFEVAPGGHTPLHCHANEHEIFIVHGSGTFVYEGTEHPFEAGHIIFVDPDAEHCFKNTSDAVLKFLCLVPE